MNELGGIVAFAGILALLNERLNELLVLPLVNRLGLDEFNAYFSLAVGTVLGVVFGVDFMSPLAALFGIALNAPVAGLIVSGLVVGGGSNLLHDIVGGWTDSKRLEVVEDELATAQDINELQLRLYQRER